MTISDKELLGLHEEYPLLDFSFIDDYREEFKVLSKVAYIKGIDKVLKWAYEICPCNAFGRQKRFCADCWQSFKQSLNNEQAGCPAATSQTAHQ